MQHKYVHIILILLLIFFVEKISAQEYISSFPSKTINKYDDYEILGANINGIWVHYSKNEDHYIELYNNNLRILQKKPLLMMDKKSFIDYLVVRDYGMYAFYSQMSNGYQYIKATFVDLNINMSNSPVTLDSIAKSGLSGFEPYFLKSAMDNSHYCVFSVQEENNSFIVPFHLFDKDLNSIVKDKFIIDQKGEYVLKSFRISNKGLITAVIIKKNTFRIDESFDINEIIILTYDSKTTTSKTYTVKQAKHEYKNIVTDISNTNDIFYLSTVKRSENDDTDISLFNYAIDLNSGNVLFEKEIPFEKESIEKTNSFEFKSWEEKASIIKPKKIIPLKDKGMMLITESEYTYSRVVRTSSYPSPYYVNDPNVLVYDQNHYFDITAYNISADSTKYWSTIMPKVQVTEGDNGAFSSFSVFESNNLLKFLYNDDIYNNGNFIEYNLNGNGTSLRKSLFSNEKMEVLPVPQKAKQIEGNCIIIPSQKKAGLQLIKIKY
jgi:hypothetical protein